MSLLGLQTLVFKRQSIFVKQMGCDFHLNKLSLEITLFLYEAQCWGQWQGVEEAYKGT